MSRLFVVKKPCVIECVYYGASAIYVSSKRMSDTALKVLLEHGFLEEKFLIKDNQKVLDDCLSNIQKLNEDILAHARVIQSSIDKARENIKG